MANNATPQRLQSAPSLRAVAAFFELLGKAISATAQSRYLRAAEYLGCAAADARVLWGDMGALCVVYANIQQSNVLVAHAQATAAVGDALPLWLEAQRLVAECRHILNARLDANTCLAGRCFEVEEDFYVRYCVMRLAASSGAAVTSSWKAAFASVKREVGYDACMIAADAGLLFAFPAALYRGARLPPLTGKERSETQAFALRCVGIMTNAPRISEIHERRFAMFIRDLLASNHLEQPFKAELTRAWDRPVLQNALRARGVFDEEDRAIHKKIDETLNKKVAADLAKHGLRWCALPSCAKQELHVFDFKQCSRCKAVVYCSAEHAALHWAATHKTECASLKAVGAKPRSTIDDAGTVLLHTPHAPHAGGKPRSTAAAGTERLWAHAPQLLSLACAATALVIVLILLAGAVLPQVAAAFRITR